MWIARAAPVQPHVPLMMGRITSSRNSASRVRASKQEESPHTPHRAWRHRRCSSGTMLQLHRRPSAGFTLMDVMTATALFAVIAATAVPQLGALRASFAARQAARQIASEFQSFRMRAIATNSNIRLTYDATIKSYSRDRQTGAGWTTEAWSPLPEGVTLGGLAVAPQFSRSGTLNANYTVTVTAYGKTRTVTINVLGQTTIS